MAVPSGLGNSVGSSAGSAVGDTDALIEQLRFEKLLLEQRLSDALVPSFLFPPLPPRLACRPCRRCRPLQTRTNMEHPLQVRACNTDVNWVRTASSSLPSGTHRPRLANARGASAWARCLPGAAWAGRDERADP